MKKFYILLITLLLISPVLYVQAQEVDILWQGETYTSPFYKGRTLWSSQSGITFLAIPHGAGIGNPANLIYKWTKNGTVLGNINGVGKKTLSFNDSIISKPQTIQIDILSGQDTVLASASVTVTPISPILTIYENNPLYGFMFHRETSGAHELEGKEVTFTAFPLFFSVSNRTDNRVNYEWRTNIGGEAETKNSVTYRTPDNVAGTSQVEVGASHKDSILQSSSKSFLIKFEK